MFTYRLWRLMANAPTKHPLYRRALMPRSVPRWWRVVRDYFASIAPIAYLTGGMLLCCAATSPATGGMVLAAIVMLVLFNGTFYGLVWSFQIAAQLANERESGEWELLCLLPSGALGAAWATATGCMSRDNAFKHRYRRHVIVLRGLLLIVVVVTLGTLLDRRTVYAPDMLMLYATFFAVLAASYLDYVQAVVLGSLTGIYAGIATNSRFDAQVWAVISFLALQVGIYALALVVGFVALPALLPAANPAMEAARLALQLLLFAAMREILIAFLWRFVAQRLNTDNTQLQSLISPAV